MPETERDQDEREQDERPWGGYLVLEDEPTHKVKRITVRPGKRLSYQRHARRAEHWFVVGGRATVTLDGEPLVFVEVLVGDYFGEDDIERLDDDYGRT